MKQLAKFALVAATLVSAASVNAQTYEKKAVNDNWGNGSGDVVVKNGTNELCWRNNFWTPAAANAKCDGALALVVVVSPPPAPKASEPAPKPAPVAPKVTTEKVTLAADALFDFDKSVLKAEGKERLDDMVGKLKSITLEVIIAAGHTDSVGADAYNQKLSVRRAEAVKAYLVSKGIEPNRIYAEGKGKKQPIADNKTKEGRAKNRRVEIEVVGTRTVTQ